MTDTSFHVSSAPDTAGNMCSSAVQAGMTVHDSIGTQGVLAVFAFFLILTFIKERK
jgi:hypothetical protein